VKVSTKPRTKVEFGDFQTPPALAERVCRLIAASGFRPSSVLEPTCGVGAFLTAAARVFPEARLVGAERNPDYVAAARTSLEQSPSATVIECDFFTHDWPSLVHSLPKPLLVIGNPPWVTNSALAAMGSENVPEKTNFRNQSGMDAITGKSNFDISEWMLLRVLEWLNGTTAVMAMLCKTGVARKVLASAWKDGLQLEVATMHRIDAVAHFGASVDACLLMCKFVPGSRSRECTISDLENDSAPTSTFAYRDDRLVADVALYDRWQHLSGTSRLRWRSGIKHDCGPVMELRETDEGLVNALGETVDIEPTHLYPMLKTSELAAAKMPLPTKWMLVTQSFVGQDTAHIARTSPKTWAYLMAHTDALGARGSSIYRNKPPFSVFGVGDYTFACWKVAISGFYKKLDFKVLGPFKDRPIVLDDLSYFVPCESEQDAERICAILNSLPVREFFTSFIFWDAKRPVTADVLGRLDIDRASEVLKVPQVRHSATPLFDFADDESVSGSPEIVNQRPS
jgi:hypothetical protein